jgi:hypothetical protein
MLIAQAADGNADFSANWFRYSVIALDTVPNGLRELVRRKWKSQYRCEWRDHRDQGHLFIHGGTLWLCGSKLPGGFTGEAGKTSVSTTEDVTGLVNKGDRVRFDQFVTSLRTSPIAPKSTGSRAIAGKLTLKERLPKALHASEGFYSKNRIPEAQRYDGKSIDRHVREKIEVGTLAEMDTTALSFMLIGEKNHALLERPSRQFKSLKIEFRSGQPVLSEGEWVSYMVGLRNDAMAHRTSSQMPTAEFEESCRAVELFLKMLGSSKLLDDFENARKPLTPNFGRAEELSRRWEENFEHMEESVQEIRQEMQDLAESNAAGLDAILRTFADAEEAGATAKARVWRSASSGEYEEEDAAKAPPPCDTHGCKWDSVQHAGAGPAASGGNGIVAAMAPPPTPMLAGGIVGVMCSYVPRIAAGVTEVPGAERLHRESQSAKAAGAHMLQPASVEELVDNIEGRNPSLVHIAGHNQYLKARPRIVGFSEGDDGNGLTELEPGKLAQFVVDAAAFNPVCALECVMINACNSIEFATALLAHAESSVRYQNKLRVICWPGLTDDSMCWQFAKGFYKRFKHCQGTRSDDWVSECYERGMLSIATKRVKLTPELIRGDHTGDQNPDVTFVALPQLLDSDSIDEAIVDHQQPLVDVRPNFVMVTVDTPSDHPALQKLHRILDGVTGAAEAPHCERAPSSLFGDVELSWSIKFAGNLESVRENQQQFIRDLKELCGEGAVAEKLSEGSIIAHIISPIENYRRVRARFENAEKLGKNAGEERAPKLHMEYEETKMDPTERPLMSGAAIDKMGAGADVGARAGVGAGPATKTERSTWQKHSGRTTGKSGYQFGDATLRPVASGLKSILRSPKQWAGKKLSGDFKHQMGTSTGNSVPLQCGAFEAMSVELGNWIVIDTDAWSQLDTTNAQRLRERFSEHGLEHLLNVLLGSQPHATVPNTQVQRSNQKEPKASEFADDAASCLENITNNKTGYVLQITI